MARLGQARLARYGTARQGWACRCMAVSGWARHGKVGRGQARLVRHGKKTRGREA